MDLTLGGRLLPSKGGGEVLPFPCRIIFVPGREGGLEFVGKVERRGEVIVAFGFWVGEFQGSNVG